MATKKSARKKQSSSSLSRVTVQGRRVPSFGDDFVVVRTGRFAHSNPATRTSDRARSLVKKVGAALSQNGVRESVVFAKNRVGVFAYSVDPADPTQILRRSSAGKKTRGRFVDGRFKAR